MFRHPLRSIGSSHKNSRKRLTNAVQPQPPVSLDAVQEIAVYIHRFHNLDLFQQGWYQIKVTARWEEDSENNAPWTPSRVTQYEAPELFSEDECGLWMIDDRDNSFFTQPFRIRYARQDVLLSIMISFNLPLNKYEGASTSAVLLKFELMYTPLYQDKACQTSLDMYHVAGHEFRIPSKALLGLHSYCPVHFDAFHTVLIDISVHITMLRAHKTLPKVARDRAVEDRASEEFEGQLKCVNDHALGGGSPVCSEEIALVKALISAQNILIKELIMLSKAINQAIDLTDFTPKLNDAKNFDTAAAAQVSCQLPGAAQDCVEKAIGIIDFQSDMLLCSISLDDLSSSFSILGHQMSCLWNTFLKFHRANRRKILEFLHYVWANDRKTEWSMWMVQSKAVLPLYYMSSGIDEPSYRGLRSKAMHLRRLTDDPGHSSATYAELRRQNIAHTKINNRSIQDMHIFRNPLQMPVMIVERAMNAPPSYAVNENSYFMHLEQKDMHCLLDNFKALTQRHGRSLSIVVFVHGFQGHHLDLRLLRNQWLLIDPNMEYLMSEANEGRTTKDFKDMGNRLAQEVVSFVKKKVDRVSRPLDYETIKLSFVGHSIGNVIIRSALSESIMQPFLRYLYTYFSISGPHLGYLYSSNTLFNSGLWLLKKIKGTQSIRQLTFTDDPDIRNTFFYKLCKQRTLDKFKNIVLVSSPQDGYIPYHSARIEYCQASLLDYSRKGKAFLEMLNNCLDQIRAPPSEHRVFIRCDVNFSTSSSGRNLNTIIGRAAHIEFLESDTFARIIMWSFPELFR